MQWRNSNTVARYTGGWTEKAGKEETEDAINVSFSIPDSKSLLSNQTLD